MIINMKEKESVVVVYTGDNKGKTSAAIGLCCRALGGGKKVAFVQFIKEWAVSEHKFFARIASVFNKNTEPFDDKLENGFRGDKLTFYKGGKGFYNIGDKSAKKISDDEHKKSARETFEVAMKMVESADYDLVICDEINNAVSDGLLEIDDLKQIITNRNSKVNLCLTGRNLPTELLEFVDIATEMKKIKHHYDDGFLATQGIDF